MVEESGSKSGPSLRIDVENIQDICTHISAHAPEGGCGGAAESRGVAAAVDKVESLTNQLCDECIKKDTRALTFFFLAVGSGFAYCQSS